ncbi:MAG: hypothetical protein K9G67_10720 [Bacteroidales bacterium]|nr:hypothetical protein [Bacteroidales bacterium]MCF8343158.1 hypothetical protein [Bacteroidales bacterium]MCF8351085.1 hypothetical protein [Bacteroidales bacterium]MCF8376817.1 hypothetical protein [Bacteroidales bacterium]MCF8400724.1 hypothetical protein [Bacteroidales bacterium]
MKNNKFVTKRVKIFLLMAFVFVGFIFQSCNEKDEEINPEADSSIEFVAAYNPNEGALIGEEYATALLTISKGELQYSTLCSYYAKSNNLFTYADMGKGNFVMGLHDDFNESNGSNDWVSQGLFYEIENGNNQLLPLIEPSEDSDYPYFVRGSEAISENAYVFYLSATNDKYYGDQYKDYLLRYNPASMDYKMAINPDGFVLSQPEVGNDTETSKYSNTFFVSNDGRYVYGRLQAYGVSGGSIHWDYEILFRYDFDTETYTRMGGPEDAGSSILGVTSDDSYLYYWDGIYKNQNLSTGQVNELSDGNTSVAYPIQWNTKGYCQGSTTGIYYYNIISGTSHKVVDEYGTADSQFDESGEHILFSLVGDEMNYLCRTHDYNEDTGWDTLASFPKAFHHLVLVK